MAKPFSDILDACVFNNIMAEACNFSPRAFAALPEANTVTLSPTITYGPGRFCQFAHKWLTFQEHNG
jgi:hypothetical protein